jgi:hypothetical protein
MSALQLVVLNVHAGNDSSNIDDETAGLIADINELEPSAVEATAASALPHHKLAKGDPITIGAIVLAAVGGGGALAKSFSPNGFFSRLAEIIKERASKGLAISIARPDGTQIKLAGSADDIVRILKAHSRRS